MAVQPQPLRLFLFLALACFVHVVLDSPNNSGLRLSLSKAKKEPYNEVDAAVPTSGGTSSPTKTGPANTVDACVISTATELSPLQVSSYCHFNHCTVTIPNSRLPHVSSVLCSAKAKGSHASDKWFFVNTTESTKAVFCFKAARVGSTFFTNVITDTMKRTKRPTSMFWEPLAGSCAQSRRYQQEDALNTLLTQNCQGRNKCQPDKNCSPMNANTYGPPVFITAANPRFFSLDIPWPRGFRRVPELASFRCEGQI